MSSTFITKNNFKIEVCLELVFVIKVNRKNLLIPLGSEKDQEI
jgi:hypothetical protein